MQSSGYELLADDPKSRKRIDVRLYGHLRSHHPQHHPFDYKAIEVETLGM
jgi:hypothetical protein